MKKLRPILAAGTALALCAGAAMAERGSDGEVKIIFWQAPSTMNPYLSGGTKEVYASSMVLEPLAKFSSSGEIVPALVEDIPTVENGGVSEDLKSITWKIAEGVLWSDGTPVTANDAVLPGNTARTRKAAAPSPPIMRVFPRLKLWMIAPSASISTSRNPSPIPRLSAMNCR